jgi:competence protein ComGC
MLLVLVVLLLIIACLLVLAVPPTGRNWAVIVLAGVALAAVAIQLIKSL